MPRNMWVQIEVTHSSAVLRHRQTFAVECEEMELLVSVSGGAQG
jgi:hypothetical protein